MKYQLFEIIEKEVCVPSEDYYCRSGDWSTDVILLLRQDYENRLYDSFEEATYEIKTRGVGNYTILPIITVK